ncbi:unnamed protein product, partial [marine sediment metagenome]
NTLYILNTNKLIQTKTLTNRKKGMSPVDYRVHAAA